MITNSIGTIFSPKPSPNAGNTPPAQPDPATDETQGTSGTQSGGTSSPANKTEASSSAPASSPAGQGAGQPAGSASSGTVAGSATLSLAAQVNEAPDEDALRAAAIAAQKQMNTDLLIKSLSAVPQALRIVSEAETETEAATSLAAGAYAENSGKDTAGLDMAAA